MYMTSIKGEHDDVVIVVIMCTHTVGVNWLLGVYRGF